MNENRTPTIETTPKALTTEHLDKIEAFLADTLGRRSFPTFQGIEGWEWRALLAAARLGLAPPPPPPAPALPPGWIAAPAEPTETMVARGAHANSEWLNDNAPIGEQRYRDPAKAVWKDMLAARPAFPPPETSAS